MAFIKRLWKDRISEFPNRRTINDGNVTKQVTVGRDEGAITEEGDSFDASNMNDLEQRIEDAYGDLQGLVASEVAQQYDSSNVIFDAEPTEGHGTGYTVTSEGIKTAIDSGLVHTKTARGSLVHITDGADNIPVKSLTSEIVAVQSGSGTPSPSNPRAISGFNSGIITRCGKNRLNNPDRTTTQGAYVINNVNVPMLAGYYVLSFNFSGTSNSSSLRINDENGNRIFELGQTITVGHNEFLINLPSKGAFVKLFSNAVGTYSNFQIEQGNQFTTFEAYNGNTYTFPFGWTVYGGYFSNKGNAVVTHKEINLSTLSWSATTLGSQNVWRTSLPTGVKGYADNFVPTNILCEQYKPNSVDNMYSGYSGISLRTSGNYIYCSRTDLNEPQGKLIAELITPRATTEGEGNLVITHMFGELVAKSKNGNYFKATLSDLGLPNIYSKNSDLLCDRYEIADITTATSNNNQITIYGNGDDPYAIRWVDLDYLNADVSTYNTAMANNKPQICYKLLNPIVLPITSQDIPTLLGENNIFSNCGDVEVTYYVDTEAIYAIRDVIDEFAMQSDWNEADNTKADYIKNKPTIPANADFSLSGLSDTDISSPSAGQVLTFDGDNWVNSNTLSDRIGKFDTWKTSTTSFTDACASLGIYSAIGAVLDVLKDDVSGYDAMSINHRVDYSQGPIYGMIVFKANNNYFSGILLSYFTSNPEIQPIMYIYENGTYAVKRI